MDSNEIVQGLVQELRRGTLIMLTLNFLKTPTYGYSLIKEMESSGITVEANTLYPLMRRLEGQGLLESQWDTTEVKPRKNYVLTPLGLEVLVKTKLQWDKITKAINITLEDDENDCD